MAHANATGQRAVGQRDVRGGEREASRRNSGAAGTRVRGCASQDQGDTRCHACRQWCVFFLSSACVSQCGTFPPQRCSRVPCKTLQRWMASATSMFLFLLLIACFALIFRYGAGAPDAQEAPKEARKEKAEEQQTQEKESRHDGTRLNLSIEHIA